MQDAATLSKKPPTGEKFVMRRPSRLYTLDPKLSADSREVLVGWDSLKATIEGLGGSVSAMPGVMRFSAKQRDPMFVRDAAFYLPHGAGRGLVFAEDTHPCMLREKKQLWEHLQKNDRKAITLPGHFEGGNLVYDRHRNILFWGVSNHDYITEISRERPSERLSDHAAEKIRKQLIKIEYADQAISGIENTVPALHQHPQLEMDGNPLRVVPMFIPDAVAEECYHLDGALALLPSGHALACRERLSKTAWTALERTIGRDMMIAVSPKEAARGATNVITVGPNIITPYASPPLKEALQAIGYAVVDPPSVGQRVGAWNFGPGAAVRCATLKVTPDKAFPDAGKEKAAPADRGGSLRK